jgi:hypothetical protein
MELTMFIPTIHLNGTSAKSLISMYTDAHRAILDAIEKLEQSAPHGRDYYPQGDSAFEGARSEHIARLTKLTEIQQELETIVIHILNNE